jgi:hypothetical protein
MSSANRDILTVRSKFLKKDFRSMVLKIEKSRIKRREVKDELLEKRNEAVVRLHLSAHHTRPQLYACLSSIICPFCISNHPPVKFRRTGV